MWSAAFARNAESPTRSRDMYAASDVCSWARHISSGLILTGADTQSMSRPFALTARRVAYVRTVRSRWRKAIHTVNGAAPDERRIIGFSGCASASSAKRRKRGRERMVDRDKVIKGLECCLGSDSCAKCNFFEYKMDCSWHLKYEALELLKAQEPRVMTLEEIPDAVFGWMEIFGQIIPCVLEDVYADDTVGFANIEDGHDYMCASDYGKT